MAKKNRYDKMIEAKESRIAAQTKAIREFMEGILRSERINEFAPEFYSYVSGLPQPILCCSTRGNFEKIFSYCGSVGSFSGHKEFNGAVSIIRLFKDHYRNGSDGELVIHKDDRTYEGGFGSNRECFMSLSNSKKEREKFYAEFEGLQMIEWGFSFDPGQSGLINHEGTEIKEINVESLDSLFENFFINPHLRIAGE